MATHSRRVRSPKRAAPIVVSAAFMFFGCQVSPLTNKIEVGKEPFVVLVGEGPDGQTDLFAGSAAGGEMFRITFSRSRESAPALDPTGVVLAFLREATAEDEPRLVFMNLSSAAEREVRIPRELGRPDRLGWSDDGSLVYLRTPTAVAVIPAPPTTGTLLPVMASELAVAERALVVEIGSPVIGRVETCDADASADRSGDALCVVSPEREPMTLIIGGQDPLTWGTDSVAYMLGTVLEVRPLGGGRARRPAWTRIPKTPRQPTYAPGVLDG